MSVVARLVCEAGSRVVLLRDFSAERFHALCHCEIYLRSGLTIYVVARLFLRSVSRIVSLRDFSCVANSRYLSLRDLFAERFHDLCCCEIFRAQRSHALCRCEIYLRNGLTHCVVARFSA